jgi:tetratricopeptide (TPR) repeat protein
VYTLQAGHSAEAVFSHNAAQTFFDRALALLKQDATQSSEPPTFADNRRLQMQAYHGRGWAQRLLGNMDAYEEDTHEVAKLAERLGDPLSLAHLRWREAYAHRWFCRYAQARETAREGARLAEAAGALRLEAMCHRELGMAQRELGKFNQAQSALESALELFAELGDIVYQIHSLTNLSTLYRYKSASSRAMQAAQKALAQCERAGLSLERRLPLGDIGATAALLGDHDLAQEYLKESLDISLQVTDRTQEIFCLGHLGWSHVGRGEPTAALDALNEALALAVQVDSCAEVSWLYAGLARALCLKDDPDGRRLPQVNAERALEVAEAHGRAHDAVAAREILRSLKTSP